MMQTYPTPHGWRGARVAGTALILLTLAAPAWSAVSLHDALEHAWQRAVAARVAEARQAEADAGKRAADSLLADAPALSIAQRSDRYQQNLGLREDELELALPLWLPGQRSARQALAESESIASEAGLAAARLALAGELRDAIWAYAAAQADAATAMEQQQTAEKLAADVARREAAGDLARTDLLLAQEASLAAKIAVSSARRNEQQALERYRLLTGLTDLPSAMEETLAVPASNVGASHPRQRLARSEAERAHADMLVARENRRDAPELSIGWQQSRDDFAAANKNSVRIGLRIPFATEARNAPQIAAANSGLIRADAEYRQTMAELEAAEREARLALEDAAEADTAAQARRELAAERLQLLEKAFALGELSLPDLIRAQSANNEARRAASQAHIALAASRARLNQAKGILP